MNILVTLDSNYVYPLCVMLRSLAETNRNGSFDVYVAHSSLTDSDFSRISNALSGVQARVHSITVGDGFFEDAPKLARTSKETYYRLLIGEILPREVHRILYIDPDTVINKSLDEFYNLDLGGNILAGGTHVYGIHRKINIARLKLKKTSCYVNAGVMLIDLDKWRQTVTSKKIFDFISENQKKLVLADQDVINVLFEDKMLAVDERIYNLDEKTYCYYSLKPFAKDRISLDWVRKNTVIIHFNGKHKPWREKKYRGRLGEYFEKYKNI